MPAPPAPIKRKQAVMFAPTLDALMPEYRPVRLFDEVFAGCDRSDWSAEDHPSRGQPPVPRAISPGADQAPLLPSDRPSAWFGLT